MHPNEHLIDWTMVCKNLRCPKCGEKAYIEPGTDGTEGICTHRFPISREMALRLSTRTPEEIQHDINKLKAEMVRAQEYDAK